MNLTEFLIQNPINNITKEVVISERLKKYPFVIKAMTGEDFTNYQKTAIAFGKKRKVSFDSGKFNELIVLNHTVEPNFRDAESIKAAGCITPEQFLYKSLLAGEIQELTANINTFSGFDTEIEEDIEEAKNS